jgi:hypothetical protein
MLQRMGPPKPIIHRSGGPCTLLPFLQVPLDQVFNKDPRKLKAFGPFAPDAELINGRAAMLGLAVMLLLEGAGGTAFFL